tara:strand:+ start:877 stop:1410 length:534 start_codon:yes stop_codon:yes gene_type:complete
MNKRIVISGAPGTGKTSLISGLSKIGYKCHIEVSREIIANQLQIKGSITPWQDLYKFSEIVIKERLKQYKLAVNEIEFYDRGIIDSFAYLLKDNISLKEEWVTIAKEHQYYKKVFITPPWEEIYHTDHERKEDFITATKIHSQLLEAYEAFNYKPILIPKTSIKERINFILNEIEQH